LAKAKKNTEKEDSIAEALDKAGIAYEREFKGIEGRQFRFDFAIPSLKIAIEYEGGVFRKKSRHTSAFGYSSDCKKYNLDADIFILTNKSSMNKIVFCSNSLNKNKLENLFFLQNPMRFQFTCIGQKLIYL
jgi:hypothetical protein